MLKKKIFRWALAFNPIFISSYALSSDRFDFFLTMDINSYSDGISIDAIKNDFKGRYKSGNLAFSTAKFETGFTYKIEENHRLSISFFKRTEYWLNFSEDTGELLYKFNNNLDVDENFYNFSLEGTYFSSEGIRFRIDTKLNEKITLGLYVTPSVVDDFVDFNASGFINAANVNQSTTEIFYNHYYTEDDILHRPVPKLTGNELSFGLSIDFNITERIYSSIIIDDIDSYIEFDPVPFSKMLLTDWPVEIDENNRFVIVPNVQGVEEYGSFVKNLSKSIKINLKFKDHENFDWYVSYFKRDFWEDYELGLIKKISGIDVISGYSLKTKSVHLGFIKEKYKLFLKVDSLNKDKRNFLSLSLSFNF